MENVRLQRSRHGLQFVQHGNVLSEALHAPGPTHSVFDVLAGLAQLAAPDSEIALLGFAAGGMIAPLRAMGGRQTIHGVDLSAAGYEVFSELCSKWAGGIHFHEQCAASWLRQSRRRFDLVIEDLSVSANGDIFKPEISWTELPGLIHRRLRPGGSIVANLIRTPGARWADLKEPLIGRAPTAHEIRFDEYENHFVLAGDYGLDARGLSRELRSLLRSIRSRLADRIQIRTLKQPNRI